MRQIAMTAALVTFFAMAIVGCLVGQSALGCAIRSLAGAIVAYAAAAIALRLAVNVMIRAVVENDDVSEEPDDESDEQE